METVTYYVGRMSTFTDRAGIARVYFDVVRDNRGGYLNKRLKGKGAAARLVNALNRKAGQPAYFAVKAVDYFDDERLNPTCKTYNMLNREAGFIDIKASDFGTCVDVGTETYHCM